MNPEERVKEIEKEISKVSIIDFPESIMLGLSLYAKFGTNGDAFHPLLNNKLVVNIMLITGAATMIWCGNKILTLSKEKTSLKMRMGWGCNKQDYKN